MRCLRWLSRTEDLVLIPALCSAMLEKNRTRLNVRYCEQLQDLCEAATAQRYHLYVQGSYAILKINFQTF